jgi:hypothetical protein
MKMKRKVEKREEGKRGGGEEGEKKQSRRCGKADGTR